ncbi:hypothetical protein [Litorivivens sp.]|uniref:hypothetical protein n=1 Tax=Litorivivens sp. TaxID=2020868 RepID=UPI003567687D
MSLFVLIGSLVLLAIALAFVAVRVLLRLPVLKHFVLGCFALASGLLAIAVFLAAWDLYSYRALLDETPVATVTFTRQTAQTYRATVSVNGEVRDYQLAGDQWQIDVRMIKWNPTISRLGVDPIFRLDRLSGRYQRLEDERSKPRTVHALRESDTIDLWHWLQKSESLLRLADTQYGSATYLPMADGAVYQVTLSHFGLVARPENRQAEEAVRRWSS